MADPPPPYPGVPHGVQEVPQNANIVYVNTNGVVVNNQQPIQGMVAVVQGLGNCPNCRVGNIQEGYSICGIALAILFFPWGVLCCLLMKEKRCSHCLLYF